MAKYLDETGLVALWAKIKHRISDGVGDIDLTPYLKIENLATINGEKLSEGGNITIDLTLFKVVESLPTSDIDETKIYLVKSAETTTGNEYSEYIYANKKWELLGTYKSEVDLTPYAKTADVNTALATKVDKETGKGLSANDFTDALKTKLDGIEAGANNYTHPTSAAGAKTSGLYKIATDATGHVTAAAAVAKADITALGIPAQDTTYNAATTSAAGLMSAADKKKLDAIEEGADKYELPTASASVLGGVKVGTNLAISADGVLSATDTTYNEATTSVAGLLSAADKTKLDGIADKATADEAIPVATIEALS